ncbi:Cpd1 protein [Scheffersomyces amazonensis]|uniref:Cpd1 protein n=1 Tax=Scheffersomyces amazonensis TaxID=1078765 RepID=UPI00315D2A08
MALGVALWLCPKQSSAIYDKLTTLMSSLNTLFPGQPPRFDPHITITTNVDVNLENQDQTREDVDRILSACVAALHSLPKKHTNLVTLGRVNSQRMFFKKLYFQVGKDPNLLSFARIIRELFVILPQDIELENQKVNPHLYSKDSNGILKRKKSKKSKASSTSKSDMEPTTKELDLKYLQERAAYKAAEWSAQEYDPHLSLAYSDIHPIDNALWRTIKTRISDYLNIENCDAEDLLDNGYGWDGGVLKLVLCEGPVNEWITLGSVDIH